MICMSRATGHEQQTDLQTTSGLTTAVGVTIAFTLPSVIWEHDITVTTPRMRAAHGDLQMHLLFD